MSSRITIIRKEKMMASSTERITSRATMNTTDIPPDLAIVAAEGKNCWSEVQEKYMKRRDVCGTSTPSLPGLGDP